MRRFPAFLVMFGMVALAAATLHAAAPEGASGRPADGPGVGQRKPGGGQGGPGGFRLIPRFAIDKLNLTAEQQQQVADLEKEVKAKLYKILTVEQQKILEEARPPMPGQGPGGAGGGQRKPEGKLGAKPENGPAGSGASGRGGQGGEKPSRPQRPAVE